MAKKYNKSKWTFAFLGITASCIGMLIGVGIIIGFVSDINRVTIQFLGLRGLPFGFLTSWGLYYFLKRNWSKSVKEESSDILDDQLF